MMKGNAISLVAIVLALSFLLAPARSGAERIAWNQSRAAALAGDLAEAVKQVEEELEAGTEGADVVAERKRLALIADVKRLREAAAALAADLEKGLGFEETLPRYKTVQEIRETAARQGRQILDPGSPSETIVAARRLLEALSAFYDKAPDAP